MRRREAALSRTAGSEAREAMRKTTGTMLRARENVGLTTGGSGGFEAEIVGWSGDRDGDVLSSGLTYVEVHWMNSSAASRADQRSGTKSLNTASSLTSIRFKNEVAIE